MITPAFIGSISAGTVGSIPSTGPLLHFDGSNGSTTFTDSHGGSAWVGNAGAALSTAQAKFGASSLATGPGYIDTLNMGAALDTNFTVEGFAFSSGGSRGLFHTNPNGSANGLALGWDGSNRWEMYHNNIVTTSSVTTLPSGWFHWAVWRTGGSIRVAINGTIVITIADTGNFGALTSMFLATYFNNGFPWVGYIDEVRIDLSTAQYGTTGFTPPSAPFT
jgi:hypothetical protein